MIRAPLGASGGALGEAVEDATHLGHALEAEATRLVVETEGIALFGDEFVEPVEGHLVGGDTGGSGHGFMVPKGCGTGRRQAVQ